MKIPIEIKMLAGENGQEEKVASINLCNVSIGSDATASDLRAALQEANQSGAARVELSVNSPGGYMLEGLDMAAAIKASSKPVTVKGYGHVASAATLLFCTAAKAELSPNCVFMVHQPYAGIVGTPEEIDAYNQNFKKMRDRAFALYAAKTGKDREELKAAHMVAQYYTAEEALAYGWVDGILDGGDSPAEKMDMAAFSPVEPGMKEILYGKLASGLQELGFPGAAEKMEARKEEKESARLMAALKDAEMKLASLQGAVEKMQADEKERQASFEAAVKEAVMKELAAMGAPPENLPGPETPNRTEKIHAAMRAGGLELAMRAAAAQ